MSHIFIRSNVKHNKQQRKVLPGPTKGPWSQTGKVSPLRPIQDPQTRHKSDQKKWSKNLFIGLFICDIQKKY